jgi:hypothetical protein
MIWAFAAIVLAVPLTLFLIRPRFSSRVEKDVQGIKTEHLIAPLVTLAVFLSAFVVAQATASFQRATSEAGNEGGAVDQFFETAGLLPEGRGREIQAATVCYARAVGEQEWVTMRSGETADDVGVWTGQIREELPKVLDGPSPVVSQLLALDRLRSESRRLRLTEAVPSIPALVLTLMFLAVLGVVIALTTFALPAIRRRSLGAITLTVAVLLGSTLFLVEELEEPYSGVIVIAPDAIDRTAASGAEDFAAAHPGVELPCDETGAPVGS